MTIINKLNQIKSNLLDLTRNQKRIFVLVVDFIFTFIILYISIFFVLNGIQSIFEYIHIILFIQLTTLISLYSLGFYDNILRAFDERVMQPVIIAIALLLFIYLSISYLTSIFAIPKSTYFVYVLFLFFYLWLSRSIARKTLKSLRSNTFVNKTIIYGAGSAGQELLGTLQVRPDYEIVGFIDDDDHLVGGKIGGIKVSSTKIISDLVSKNNLNTILLAMPSVSRERKKEIINTLEPLPVKVLSVPSMHQVVSGEVALSDVQEVDVIDLLGRDPTPPVDKLLCKNITGKSILVTGAGGSIGSEICRQIAKLNATKIVLFDVSEFSLYSIESEIKDLLNGKTQIVPVIGSVLDSILFEKTLTQNNINTVYHAAAYKHVPLVEANPFSGITNNTIGTASAAKASLKCNVDTFVLISTDKAVRPTNVMGASKRLSELVCQALAQGSKTTQFSIVRFGNVLGSSGSVVPLFKKQINSGGPVTVTHPEITRYFMTIPEAAQLVIQAGAMGSGGDVFLLDMGEPVKIVSLAKKMIHLSGLTERDKNGKGDISIKFTGLRPGEKLFEELLIEGDNVQGTYHPRIMRSVEKSYNIDEIEILLSECLIESKSNNIKWLISTLERYVEDYKASTEIKSLTNKC